MTTTFLGGMTVGVACPGAVACADAGVIGINGAVPDLESRIAALLGFVPMPVDLSSLLANAIATVNGIQAAITAGIQPPDISAQVAIVAAELALLQAALALVNQQLGIILALQPHFLVGGLVAYSFDGSTANLGTELDAAIATEGTPSGSTKALLIAATTPDAWAALSAILKTAP